LTEPEKSYGSYGAYDAGAGRAGGEESVFWYYLDLLIRRIWVIITVLVIASTVGVIKAFREPSVYEATARILVEKQTQRLMQFQNENQDYFSWDPDFYNTQAGIAKSRAVMELALQDPAIRRTFATIKSAGSTKTTGFLQEFKETIIAVLGATPVSPPEPWEILRAQIHTEAVKNTHFVSVSAEHTVAEQAADIANAVATAFERFSYQEKVEHLGESFTYLQKEKDKEEKTLAAAEESLKKFFETSQGFSLSDTSSANNPSVQRMNELNVELGKVHLERIELQSELESMRSITPSNTDVKASSERLFSSPVVRREASLMTLRGRLEEAEKELALLSNTYGSQHPLYKTADTNISLLRNQFLEGFRQALLAREKDSKMLQTKEEELQRQYEAEKKITVGLTGEANQYLRLKSEVDRHRHLYESLVSRLLEVDISSGLVQGNVSIVDRAKVPTAPARPNRLRIALFSVLIGLFCGCGLAFLLENMDHTVKTPEDLKERLGLPLLGFVPAIDSTHDQTAEEKTGTPGQKSRRPRARTSMAQLLRKFLAELLQGVIPSVEEATTAHEPLENVVYRGTIVARESASSVTEAYRHIRTSLFYSTPIDEGKPLERGRILVVTSSKPGEGKTTTCTNLATVIAQNGKKVLLVDADLHRPMVRKVLGLKNKMGLTDVITGAATWTDVIQAPVVDGAEIKNLHVISSGTKSPNPAELIGSDAMRKFLRHVVEAYDWVLLDTPPALFVSDASVLGALCDGVILVVKSGTSARYLLARAKDQLEAVKAKILGTILNSMTVARIGRHYSYYYYHGYSRYTKDYKKFYYTDKKPGHENEDDSKESDV